MNVENGHWSKTMKKIDPIFNLFRIIKQISFIRRLVLTMTTLHTIDCVYKYPVIAIKKKSGSYTIRLHDGRISDIYDGSFDIDEYIAFQKKIAKDFFDIIGEFDDWTVDVNPVDSMELCTIHMSKKIDNDDFIEVSGKKKPVYTRTKFKPIKSFPFTNRASFCTYFDNIICTKLISDINAYGPRTWIVEFNIREISNILSQKLAYVTYSDIDEYKAEMENIIIEKMVSSSKSAKWNVYYDKTYLTHKNYIISFDQF